MIDNLTSSITGEGCALSEFVRIIHQRNPFVENRVSTSGKSEADVVDIHQRAFHQLTRLAQQSLHERQALGAVLWGEAGIGKSHLLGRLARWARQRACFVNMPNLQAAPHALSRSLLRSVLGNLTWSPTNHLGQCQLYQMIKCGMAHAIREGDRFQRWDRLQRSFQTWLNRPTSANSDALGSPWLDHTTSHVLFQFFRSVYRSHKGKEDGQLARLACRWLAGQALDAEDARRLQLPPALHPEDPVGLLDEQEIKEVLVVLMRLAGNCDLPFLLAFDQVDNLDEEQFAALSRFLEALLDSSSNLLIVTAGIQSSLMHWRETKVIQDSAWDRLAHFTVRLERIAPAEAEQIVQTRIDGLLQPFDENAELQQIRRSDSLFPLGERWKQQYLLDKADLRPRDVINWARVGWSEEQERIEAERERWLEGWPNQQTAKLAPSPNSQTVPQRLQSIDDMIGLRIAKQIAARQAKPHELPPDDERLAGLLYRLLEGCVGERVHFGLQKIKRVAPPKRTTRPQYDLDLIQRPIDSTGTLRTGVLVSTANNATSVAACLRRLRENTSPVQRIILVTDERVGLPLGEQGRLYLEELEQSSSVRFQAVEIPFAEYVQLDAWQGVIDQASSGDLELELPRGKTEILSANEVIDSHLRTDRYRSSPLLREILMVPSPAEDTLFTREDTADLPTRGELTSR